MQRRTFESHLDQYRSSMKWSTTGVVIGAVAWVFGAPVVAGVAGLAAAGLAYRAFKDGSKRHHGLNVEATFLTALAKQCEANGWELKTDIMLPGIGNLDAVVVAGFTHFVVELKSYLGFRETAERGEIVRCAGGASAAKQLQQVNDQVSGYQYAFDHRHVRSVLWCPNAKGGTAKETGLGVALVNGGMSTLCDYIARTAEVRNAVVLNTPLFPDEGAAAPRPRKHLTAVETMRARSFA